MTTLSPRQKQQCLASVRETLGLAALFSEEDVKQAYLERVKTVHPDRGGNAEQFKTLQEAFERATACARFHSMRHEWIAQAVDGYVLDREIVAWAGNLGGQVELEGFDWLRDEIGEDFAQLSDQIVGLRLTGPTINDKAIEQLLEWRTRLLRLHRLDLSDSRVTDYGLLRLKPLVSLESLALRNTAVTAEGLAVVHRLPRLATLDLAGVRVGWLFKTKLRWMHSELELA